MVSAIVSLTVAWHVSMKILNESTYLPLIVVIVIPRPLLGLLIWAFSRRLVGANACGAWPFLPFEPFFVYVN